MKIMQKMGFQSYYGLQINFRIVYCLFEEPSLKPIANS